MATSFNYKKKFSSSYFYPFIAFVILVAVCLVSPFGIRFPYYGRLEHPQSLYLLIVCAIITLVFALSKFAEAKKSEKNPEPILLDESKISFPHEKGQATGEFSDVDELYYKIADQDDDDGDSVIIRTKAVPERYEFFEDHFDSKEQFSKFYEILTQKCKNITNRPL